MSDREKRVHATGFSKITDVEGKDFPEMNLFLQKRWEDKAEISMPNAWVRSVVHLHYNGQHWQQHCHLFHYVRR